MIYFSSWLCNRAWMFFLLFASCCSLLTWSGNPSVSGKITHPGLSFYFLFFLQVHWLIIVKGFLIVSPKRESRHVMNDLFYILIVYWCCGMKRLYLVKLILQQQWLANLCFSCILNPHADNSCALTETFWWTASW